MPQSLFNISCRPEACNFIKKEILAQVFSCEFCEISKNTFFKEQIRAIASVRYTERSEFPKKNKEIQNIALNLSIKNFAVTETSSTNERARLSEIIFKDFQAENN